MTRNDKHKNDGPRKDANKNESSQENNPANNERTQEHNAGDQEKMEIKDAHATGMGALGRTEEDQLGKLNYGETENDDEVY